jgi:uncharacterized protein (DUF2147 family)
LTSVNFASMFGRVFVRRDSQKPDCDRLTSEAQAGEHLMRAKLVTILAAASLSIVGLTQAIGADLTADGLWQAVDKESGQPTGWFLIHDHDGLYEGVIVKMYLKPGETPDIACDQCSDDRRGKPWLGLDIIRGMKRDGLNYNDGTILDPRYGRIYSAKMTLTPDGQTLVVRGYLGISLLGQNQYWTRLPDTAFQEIDPRFNPNQAAHKPKKMPKPAAAGTH